MRGRLLAVLAVLFAVLLVALGVPLARSYASAQARSIYIDRVADLARFAELVPANPTDVDERAVLAELRRYEDVYGIPVTLLGADGREAITSRPGLLGADPRAVPAVRAALSGRAGSPPERILPWDRTPLVVAQPVVRDADVVGAVVSVSDPAVARGRVLRVWGLLVAVGVVALGAGLMVALAIARWVLRPVAVLDAAAHQIAVGDLSARVPSAGGPAELRRLGEAFNLMAAGVQTSLESQRAFVADASHQLRNPLGALLVRLQGLTLSVGPEQQAAVERAAGDGRHLAETLDRMLELARAEHVEAAPGPVDVEALVDERLASWRVVAEHRGLTIRRTGSFAVPARHEVEAVNGALDAVLDNAIKYSPAGGTVTVGVVPRRDAVEIVVGDEGPGLADEELSRAGDRFWRSGRHPEVSGSGLGLSIATTLLARHGGTLSVGPGPGRGLEVRLRLPTVDRVDRVAAQGLRAR